MKWTDYMLMFLPAGLPILAGILKNKDANTTGADDAWGDVIMQLAPVVPDLIHGNVGDNATDKAMAAIFQTSRTYLQGRGKLPA